MSARRILVLDDDSDIRDLLRALLERAGFSVEEAADGKAGLRAFYATSPDLVLLDVSMPGLDGFEVAELVRGHRKTRHLPLMFLTGEAGNDARARKLGAIACLAKPFDPVALSSLIATAVNPHAEGARA